MQKGQVQIILIGVLVLAIALAGGFYLARSTTPKPSPTPTPVVSYQTPQPIPSITPGETAYTESDRSANWKTYTDKKYKFLLKYPPSWKPIPDYGDETPFALYSPDYKANPDTGNPSVGYIFSISVYIKGASDLTLEKWIEQTFIGPISDNSKRDDSFVPTGLPYQAMGYQTNGLYGDIPGYSIYLDTPKMYLDAGCGGFAKSKIEALNTCGNLTRDILSTFKSTQ